VPDLVIRDLRVDREGRVVLDACSADFPSGRRTVLWGVSGSGKSTLLAAIAGLLVPRSGTIQWGSRVFFSRPAGIDVPPHERHVGFVFQDLALWPHLRAIDHVSLVGRPTGLSPAEAQALLDSVGLSGRERRRPGQLSGGEQQRLAIARALAGHPSVLLLDEPFSSADRRTKDSLYELLRHVSGLVPGPTIYVTHQRDDAVSLAETAVTLEAGRLAPADRPWDDVGASTPQET
jgi:ABC-type sulfate/molybdate transport systems ATPase subunit